MVTSCDVQIRFPRGTVINMDSIVAVNARLRGSMAVQIIIVTVTLVQTTVRVAM